MKTSKLILQIPTWESIILTFVLSWLKFLKRYDRIFFQVDIMKICRDTDNIKMEIENFQSYQKILMLKTT